MHYGDTLLLSFEIKNNGTDSFKWSEGDTMTFFMNTEIWGEDVYWASNYVRFGTPDSFNLPAGDKDTLYFSSVAGNYFFPDSRGEILPPSNAKVCYRLAVLGGNLFANGDSITYFTDSGFDSQAYNRWDTNHFPNTNPICQLCLPLSPVIILIVLW